MMGSALRKTSKQPTTDNFARTGIRKLTDDLGHQRGRVRTQPRAIGLRTQDLSTLLTVRANARRVNGLVSIIAFWLSPLAAERSVYPVI